MHHVQRLVDNHLAMEANLLDPTNDLFNNKRWQVCGEPSLPECVLASFVS
jgi:hypothetical protein